MLLSLLILTARLAQEPVSPPGAGQAPDLVAAAADMAREGRDGDALVAFQRIAATDPADHTARLWIARLQERMGDTARAEAVYRSVLLEDANNVEAMVGVGTTLIARDAADEAVEVLEDAEQRDPSNVAVILALARAHELLGHDTVAISYWQRAVDIEPSAQHRMVLERALLARRHRFELRGGIEQFGGAIADSRDADLRINLRAADTLRVSGRVELQRKFSEDEARGGGGLEWRWKPQTTIIGQAIVGPDNRIMPEGDYLGAVDHTYHSVGWTGTFRYFDFTGARVFAFSPAGRWAVSDRFAAGATYAFTATQTAVVGRTTGGQSLTLRGEYQWLRRLAIDARYAIGVDSFENFSIDQIGDFRATTVTLGGRIQAPSLLSISAAYQRQWRDDSVGNMHRFILALGQRF